MSDRTNRDKGNKNAKRKNKWYCGCWLCISDKEKKHRIMSKGRTISKNKKYIYTAANGSI